MKKQLVALMALGVAASSQANVDFYLTGATAFRTEVKASLPSLFTGAPAVKSGPSSSQYTISGTLASNPGLGTVTIYASYSGSGAGIATLVDPANNPVSLAYVGYTTGTAITPAVTTATAAFSDVKQETTDFSANNGYTDLSGNQYDVAIVPFVFVHNANADANRIVNVTPQAAGAIFNANGYSSLNFFTGNASDTTKRVYLFGRDNSSGTRMTVLAETYQAIGKSFSQYTVSNGNWVIYGAPGTGYSSGGTLIAAVTNNTSRPIIAYAGIADAAGVGSANWVPYNGAAYNRINTRTGRYTLWTTENLYVDPNASDDQVTVANALLSGVQTYISNNYGSADADTPLALPLSQMLVHRNADGGQIF